MADAKHTPGPWAARQYGKLGRYHIVSARRLVIATVERMGSFARWPDADLIAAAPELLAACEASLEHLEGCVPTSGWGTRNAHEDNEREAVAVKVRAAIAKARGDSTDEDQRRMHAAIAKARGET